EALPQPCSPAYNSLDAPAVVHLPTPPPAVRKALVAAHATLCPHAARRGFHSRSPSLGDPMSQAVTIPPSAAALLRKLEEMAQRFDAVQASLSDPAVLANPQRVVAASRELGQLGP